MPSIQDVLKNTLLDKPNEFTEDITIDGGTLYVGAGTPDPKAAIQIDSTTQGFLLPRMTTAERNAILSPPEGLMVWNTSTSKINIANPGWNEVSGGGATALDDLTDVDLTTTAPVNNDVLTYDGTNWVPAASGGGTNADTLDTLDSTQFLRSDVADTKTAGDLNFDDGVKLAFGNDPANGTSLLQSGTVFQLENNATSGIIQIITETSGGANEVSASFSSTQAQLGIEGASNITLNATGSTFRTDSGTVTIGDQLIVNSSSSGVPDSIIINSTYGTQGNDPFIEIRGETSPNAFKINLAQASNTLTLQDDTAHAFLTAVKGGSLTLDPVTANDLVLDGLKWPQADGTVDQYLKTDGAGQLSWGTPTGGGDVAVQEEGVQVLAAATTFNFTGDYITATDAGGGVANIDVTIPEGVGSQPGFKGASVYSTTAQNISTNTNTALIFDLEEYDTNNYHDNATNNTRITVSEAGYYLLMGSLRWSADGNGQRVCYFKINGTTDIGGDVQHPTPGAASGCQSQTMYYLNAGDYVEFWVYQDSTVTLSTSVANNNHYPRFTLTKIETAASGGGFSGASVTKSADQTGIAHGTATAITFDQEDFDTDTYHDNVTNNTRLTVSTTGYYIVTATGRFINNADNGLRRLDIRVNGTTSHGVASINPNSVASGYPLSGSKLLYLTAGDYVEMMAQQNSGGSLDFQDADACFSIVKIDATTGGATGYTEEADTTTLTGNSRTMADTTSTAIGYTLPTGVAGEFVEVQDIASNAATNNITLTPQSGEKVENVVDDTFIIDTNGGGVKLLYTTTRGWIVTKG